MTRDKVYPETTYKQFLWWRRIYRDGVYHGWYNTLRWRRD